MGLRILKSLIDDAFVRDDGTPEGIRGERTALAPGGLPMPRRTSSGERRGDVMPKG
jgi:hypothetical protein